MTVLIENSAKRSTGGGGGGGGREGRGRLVPQFYANEN